MTAPRSRRSVLRCFGAASTLALAGFAGCSAPGVGDEPVSVPVFVDNRDDAGHDVRVWIDGTEEPFRAEFSVEAGALVRVTEVGASGFCLHARVLGFDGGELVECPAPDESDYSASGYVVVIRPESADGRGSRWVIRPVRTPGPSAESSE